MKTINLYFCDFFKSFDAKNNDFVSILSKHYIINLTSKNPDYVIYSCFGNKHLKYKNSILIFYTGEAISPNFNICDYAIGFDYISFGDRYLRYPLYKLFKYREIYNEIKKNDLQNFDKDKGCTFVCSNGNGMSERKIFFEKLSKKYKVKSGGKYLNNIGFNVPDKIEFLSKSKFNICFENCLSDGYSTEKIVEAFRAGTVPIYYGNKLIDKEFNKESFINCHDYNDFDDIVETILAIDSDDEKYKKMINAKKVLDENVDEDDSLERFLLNIFETEKQKAKRIPDGYHYKKEHDDYKKISILKKMLSFLYFFKKIINKIIK